MTTFSIDVEASSTETWGERGRLTEPWIKHHALHDARAQAHDLINLLEGKETESVRILNN